MPVVALLPASAAFMDEAARYAATEDSPTDDDPRDFVTVSPTAGAGGAAIHEVVNAAAVELSALQLGEISIRTGVKNAPVRGYLSEREYCSPQPKRRFG